VPRSEITIGFVGSGAVEKKNTAGLLRDFIDANGGAVKAVLPLTKEHWNENLAIVADFLIAQDIPIEAIVDDTTAKMREIKAVLTVVRRQHQSTAVPHKMASLLEDARDASLIVLWDDEDDNVHSTVREVADRGGITLLDLTDGLDKIDLQLPENEAEEDDEDPISDEVPDDEDEPVVSDEESEIDKTSSDQAEYSEAEENAADEEDQPEDEFEDDGGYDELPSEDEEEFELPQEDEEPVLTELMDTNVGSMNEFQARLLLLLEKLVDAITHWTPAPQVPDLTEAAEAMAAAAPAKPVATKAKPAPAPEPPKPVRRTVKAAKKSVAPPAKKVAPAKKTAPAAVAPKGMSKAAAQKIMAEYRPRRGRPPAEVTEARKVLGLI
jgi:hypothetical protein